VEPGDPHEIDERLDRARSQLLRIPGVLSVGMGYKRRGNAGTDQRAWIVLVREKRPPSAVRSRELIPREVLGLPTDVWTAPRVKKLACESFEKFDTLVGGIRISNLKHRIASGSLIGDSFGTLGFFATRNDSSSRDNIVLISNHHVLADSGGVVGDTIYQPKVVPGSPPTVADADLHPIGKIHKLVTPGNYPYTYPGDAAAKPYYLDCGTATIATDFSSCCHTNCGIKFANSINGLQNTALGSSAITGIARVTNDDIVAAPQPLKVFKSGKDTGWTTGKLFTVDFSAPNVDNPALPYENTIVIEDTSGGSCGGGTIFADHGDSGAVIVNEQHKVIGLLIGLLDLAGQRIYLASPIHPVLDKLGVTLVSTQHTAGASGSPSALESTLQLDETPSDVARATGLRDAILASERGRLYRGLVDRHREEVVRLVNRVRPVTVAWHRVRGPDFLGHVVHASRHAGHAVPRELDGVQRAQAFDRVMEALVRHGSAALRDDIERHQDEVRGVLRETDDLVTLAGRIGATDGN
jgi:hypothetical protein